ncbi:response regulator [Cohnella sp. GbtcB17]|uniref:response regulator n=1 Tax=Cohnella sp. GbtcB17 TaxID=2824762 RepID=UPI001C311479|nr:response regulator [Cohnella sp. GbtcB17]
MYRVILVDDEPEICKGLRLKIAWERLGFEIVGEARNGKEALAAIASERPQLLLTDIRMPVMDGLELLQACKRLHTTTSNTCRRRCAAEQETMCSSRSSVGT